MNNPNDTQTLSGNGTTTSTPKRKGSRKASSSAAPKQAPARRAAAPEPNEILFKQAPNPYVQPVPPYIWIDHPQDGERLGGPVYVIRLGVGGAETVELSIDKGPWQPCRLTSGYWWYDWEGIAPGKHNLVARMRTSDGRWLRTPATNIDYRP